MMNVYLIFQSFKGRCHGNQIMLWKCYQRRLIPLAFVAQVLENELQYHGLAVRINSRDDGDTSSKNLVNFCLVTPEMTGLICIRQVWHGQKLAYVVEYLRTYWTDFLSLFTIWKMMNMYLIFQFIGTLPWQPNNAAIMKANWYYVHSSDSSTVLFRYYSLWGNTAAPSGLLARLCHAFLVSF